MSNKVFVDKKGNILSAAQAKVLIDEEIALLRASDGKFTLEDGRALKVFGTGHASLKSWFFDNHHIRAHIRERIGCTSEIAVVIDQKGIADDVSDGQRQQVWMWGEFEQIPTRAGSEVSDNPADNWSWEGDFKGKPGAILLRDFIEQHNRLPRTYAQVEFERTLFRSIGRR